MGCPLSVTFTEIYMIELENDIVVLLKPESYRKCVDDIFNGGKVNTNDILFERLINCHPKTKLTIE